MGGRGRAVAVYTREAHTRGATHVGLSQALCYYYFYVRYISYIYMYDMYLK